ncbi:hypothetical protein DL770_002914 [Monosporascus sp. CRB-9-2]|nr:hypothetical protein DL770_002914 [Monosporascus sp. CRB-9-2]
MATLKTAAALSSGDAAAGNNRGNGTVGGPDDNANRYRNALDELLPLRPVLAGLNHRNRNQHRRARWWGAFGMLRRHVGKLADELDVAAARFAKTLSSASSNNNANAGNSNSSSSKKKRKRGDGGGETPVVTAIPALARADERAKWLRDALLPKCYLAFSQLAADSQFATLGVVLLGVLAQVHAACVRLVGEAAVEPVGAVSLISASPSGAAAAVTSRSDGSNPAAAMGADKEPGGTVVSREEVARAEKRRRAQQQQQQEEGSSSRPPLLPGRESDNRSSAVAKEDTAGSTTVTAVAREEGKGEERPRPAQKKTKKKKAKKGDEFDNLFKSLF